MTHFEVRKKFIEFFQKNQHKVLPSSSLIPQNDPSILFVNAGMNQFKNIFLGLETPIYKNVLTVQKCLRAGGKHNDIETVGETSWHHTFFEMLGNFSFGGYFKKEAICLAWEFLTQELGLTEEHLWITVHCKDDESYEIWKNEQKIPENKIYRLKDKDNFWQMGKVGPCGPCTEIHYYNGKETRPNPHQFMEIWNLVFMEFYDTEKGTREKLPALCVDTGMGLERLCSLLQSKTSDYHTDLFSGILLDLEKACAFKYDFKETKQNDKQKAFRVVADHSRAVGFLMDDGVFTGNEGANYVLRRIIRRALYYSRKLKPKKNLLQVGVEKTISIMSEIYPSLKQNEKHIQSAIQEETEKFSNSLQTGMKKLAEEMKSLPKKFIPAQTVWNLYSSYGLPVDLTRLIAGEKGWTVAGEEEIKKQGEEQRQNTSSFQRQNSQHENTDLIKQMIQQAVHNLQGKINKTLFTGYEKNKEKGQILFTGSVVPLEKPAFMDRDISSFAKPADLKISFDSLIKGQKGWLILDKTCFYPEGGGPIGDPGRLKTETGSAQVLDCQKKGDFIVHEVKVLEGKLEKNQMSQMEVDENHRKGIQASHTATHLLNSALRSVLGKSVRQAGSLVESGRLRFDFTYFRSLTKKECQQIEETLWQSLEKEEELSSSYKNFEQAKKEGAIFLQGENYGQKVRVVRIGKETSKELCGGIHVQNTREIEDFKIISEKGIQSGVRRITAYTGSLAKAWESFLAESNLELRKYLKLPLPGEKKMDLLFFEKEKHFWVGSVEKQNPFLKWIEYKDKELKTLRKKIVHLGNKESENPLSQNQKWVKIKSRRHPLAQQILDLREHLKLPPLKMTSSSSTLADFKDEESNSPLYWLKTKEREVQKLNDQLEKIKKLDFEKDKLMEQSKNFKIGELKGQLLVLPLPLEDRKILSDISDSLLSKLSSGVLILLGEAKDRHPVLVNLTKNFETVLSAGDILKNTIAPLCQGQGGGKASFAQGSISNRSAFFEVERILLKKWAGALKNKVQE